MREPGTPNGLAAVKNRRGFYIRADWTQLQALKPYELYYQRDGSVLAQNVLKHKFTLEHLGVSSWCWVSFQDRS